MSDFQFTSRIGETLKVTIDFSKDLEIPWRANYQYEVGDFVTIGALVYECTNAGKSDRQLPESITTTIAATQTDGTVEWTCRDWSTSGSDTISAITVTADTGITIDSSAISRSLYVNITFTTTAVGVKDVTCEADTAAGETLISKLGVLVK